MLLIAYLPFFEIPDPTVRQKVGLPRARISAISRSRIQRDGALTTWLSRRNLTT